MDSQANHLGERSRFGPAARTGKHAIRPTISTAITAALATITLVLVARDNRALAASSLVNGNFETGDLTGWTVDTPYGGDASAVANYEYCPPTWEGCGPEGGWENTYITPPQAGSYFALLTSYALGWCAGWSPSCSPLGITRVW